MPRLDAMLLSVFLVSLGLTSLGFGLPQSEFESVAARSNDYVSPCFLVKCSEGFYPSLTDGYNYISNSTTTSAGSKPSKMLNPGQPVFADDKCICVPNKVARSESDLSHQWVTTKTHTPIYPHPTHALRDDSIPISPNCCQHQCMQGHRAELEGSICTCRSDSRHDNSTHSDKFSCPAKTSHIHTHSMTATSTRLTMGPGPVIYPTPPAITVAHTYAARQESGTFPIWHSGQGHRTVSALPICFEPRCQTDSIVFNDGQLCHCRREDRQERDIDSSWTNTLFAPFPSLSVSSRETWTWGQSHTFTEPSSWITSTKPASVDSTNHASTSNPMLLSVLGGTITVPISTAPSSTRLTIGSASPPTQTACPYPDLRDCPDTLEFVADGVFFTVFLSQGVNLVCADLAAYQYPANVPEIVIAFIDTQFCLSRDNVS